MELSNAQRTTLRNFIAADPVLSQFPNNSDGNFEIAARLNLDASPAFIVWKTSVQISEIMSNGFRWQDVDGLTAGKARIWDWMSRLGTNDPSKANIRQGIQDAFGAGSAMETAILPHCKRNATVAEKLFANGTGSDASPARMNDRAIGPISYQEIEQARNG